MRLIFILSVVFLSSCVLRTGASLHDTMGDTYFRGGDVIGTVSLTQEITDTPFEIYIQHKSLLLKNTESNCGWRETSCGSGGRGLNEIGANVKFNLY